MRLAVLLGAALLVAAPMTAQAGDFYQRHGWRGGPYMGHGYRPIHRPYYGNRGYRPVARYYAPPRYYRQHRGNDAVGAAAVGLLFGAFVGALAAQTQQPAYNPQVPVYTQDPRYTYYPQAVEEAEPLYVQPDGSYGRVISKY